MALSLDPKQCTPTPKPVATVAGPSGSATPPRAPTPFAAAYAAKLDAIRAVPLDELVHLNLDVPSVVMSTLGRLPRLLALRGELVAKAPTWNVDALDSLDDCARAAWHAYSLHAAATTPPAALGALFAEATESRAALLADATTAAHHGFIESGPLDQLRGPNGYANAAFDVSLLVNLFSAAWPRVEGKTAVTRERLDAAAILADRLLVAAGIKAVSKNEIVEAAQIRDQAFTLFVRTYDAVRRAVVFARWDEDDADLIAPSLYSGRSSRRSPKDGAATAAELGAPGAGTVADPNAPATTLAGPAGPAAPVAAPAAPAGPAGGPFVA